MALQLVVVHDMFEDSQVLESQMPICKVAHKEIDQLKHFSILTLSKQDYEQDGREYLNQFEAMKNMGKSLLIDDFVKMGGKMNFKPDKRMKWELNFGWDCKSGSFYKIK